MIVHVNRRENSNGNKEIAQGTYAALASWCTGLMKMKLKRNAQSGRRLFFKKIATTSATATTYFAYRSFGTSKRTTYMSVTLK